MPIINIRTYDPFDFEKITVSNVVKTLTASKYSSAGAKSIRALITVEDAQIYYSTHGADPDADVGHIANPFDALLLENLEQVSNFRAVRITDDAILKVTYLKR